jgi:hypothetical protein
MYRSVLTEHVPKVKTRRSALYDHVVASRGVVPTPTDRRADEGLHHPVNVIKGGQMGPLPLVMPPWHGGAHVT